MDTQTSMSHLTGRAEQLVDALADAIISTAEAAAERLDLAARVAQIQQRMAAFGTVLESVGAQKQVLLNKLEEPELPEVQRQLVRQQIDLLTAQETEILKRAGATPHQAQQAIGAADESNGGHMSLPDHHLPGESPDERLYRRDGRRFVRTEADPTPNGGHGS